MVYRHFQNYVLRTPLLPVSEYFRLTSGPQVDEEALLELCQHPVVQEALLLASPSVYVECLKWIDGHLESQKRKEKLIFSLLKYISRMSSRCTPFGLFAGTSVGKVDQKTDIKLAGLFQHNRHTRLDMNFLVAFAQNLGRDPEIKTQLQYYPNSSLYLAGDRLRYVEYYYEGGQRFHQIVAIENDHYLSKVLTLAKKGATIAELSQSLVDDEVTIEESEEYISQLIDSQLLISELEPAVSGPEFHLQLMETLKRLSNVEGVSKLFHQISEAISNLDKRLGNPGQAYRNITDLLQQTNTEFDRKYLFQIDMQPVVRTNTIGQGLMERIYKAINFFNRISLPNPETEISQFQKAFYSRYEDEEVALPLALDVELGVGFLQGSDAGDTSPLLDNIDFPERQPDIQDLKWSPVSAMLRKKLTKCIAEGQTVMELEDDDLPDLDSTWGDLPDTMSGLVEIVSCDGEETAIFNGIAGSNGATLMGRFCHGDEEIHQHVRNITECEERINNEKVMAEILHLPESRVGNIILRPSLREYEIPYLSNSALPADKQISIDDLVISTRPDGKITVKSRRLGKEVIPCLTVAHNFARNALPIYQFLASISMQQKRKSIGFGWPLSFEGYDFLPRVTYAGIIFSPAIWHLNQTTIQKMIENQKDAESVSVANLRILEKNKIPGYATLVQGDNELLINTRNVTCLNMLLDLVKKEKRIQLKEFLHNENGPAHSDDEKTWTNQIIISFYNGEKLKENDPC